MDNPFHNALAQLKRAQEVGGLNAEIVDRMSHPEREIRISIPVTMDNGELKIFEGYRVQHSSLMGPYKGGIRFHPDTDIEEVKALALWMSLKTAIANISLGGGKGGITVDTKSLSKKEIELLARGWVHGLYRNIGPHIDIPAPDVNTTPEIMSWMVDEYEKLTGDTTKATFTGKPLTTGGSEGRDKATGLGGFMVFDALKNHLNIQPGASVAIQGMGNVGGFAARIFIEHGYKVIALSDSQAAVYDPNGLDIQVVEEYKKTNGSLVGFPNAETITNEELLLLKVDILIPSALENQITEKNADQVKAKVILELANGPTTTTADDILFAKGVHIIPDILANAGGVIVSSFEREQNLANEHWTEAEVNDKLQVVLARESQTIWAKAANLNTDLRRAAFVIALERLDQATKQDR